MNIATTVATIDNAKPGTVFHVTSVMTIDGNRYKGTLWESNTVHVIIEAVDGRIILPWDKILELKTTRVVKS